MSAAQTNQPQVRIRNGDTAAIVLLGVTRTWGSRRRDAHYPAVESRGESLDELCRFGRLAARDAGRAARSLPSAGLAQAPEQSSDAPAPHCPTRNVATAERNPACQNIAICVIDRSLHQPERDPCSLDPPPLRLPARRRACCGARSAPCGPRSPPHARWRGAGNRTPPEGPAVQPRGDAKRQRPAHPRFPAIAPPRPPARLRRALSPAQPGFHHPPVCPRILNEPSTTPRRSLPPPGAPLPRPSTLAPHHPRRRFSRRNPWSTIRESGRRSRTGG
jgi:hypothetical protein